MQKTSIVAGVVAAVLTTISGVAYAHHAGTADPGSYALVLERVGNETTDPAFASYWLCEAANIWANTLGDAHRAVHVPLQRTIN